jgi:hypothetical protein
VLRLIAFLVTGFWPSAKSLLALNRRVDALEQRLQTLTKKHNTLAGSYYAETEPAAAADASGAVAVLSGEFPEDEFQRRLEERRRPGAVING